MSTRCYYATFKSSRIGSTKLSNFIECMCSYDKKNLKTNFTCVNDNGSDVAPHAPQMLCSTNVIANFWWGIQCLALHISSASPCAICMWIRKSIFSKHSAASSIKPNWKRFWSKKLSAKALRSASGGNAVSCENCNWENNSCKKKKEKNINLNSFKISIEAFIYNNIFSLFNAAISKLS